MRLGRISWDLRRQGLEHELLVIHERVDQGSESCCAEALDAAFLRAVVVRGGVVGGWSALGAVEGDWAAEVVAAVEAVEGEFAEVAVCAGVGGVDVAEDGAEVLDFAAELVAFGASCVALLA
jgi:hypothetical protein